MHTSDHIVWDVLDPFAPPDPTQYRLHTLIQAEITRMRRYELIGPLQSIQREFEFPYDDDDSDDESCVDETDVDADDEQEDDDDEEDKPHRIILPRLLHTHPICYVSSPSPSPSPSTSTDEDSIGPLADLSSTDDDQAEAEERARKAKRDAHRSRLKALAILGPEAATAISSMIPGSEI